MAGWDTTTPRPVEVIKGACLLLRRAALDQVGLLDDRYFMYTEEVDLCYRLAAAGWDAVVRAGGGRNPLRRGQQPAGGRGHVSAIVSQQAPVLPQVRRRGAGRAFPGLSCPGLRTALDISPRWPRRCNQHGRPVRIPTANFFSN